MLLGEPNRENEWRKNSSGREPLSPPQRLNTEESIRRKNDFIKARGQAHPSKRATGIQRISQRRKIAA